MAGADGSVPTAVLGLLLIAAGIMLGVTSSVLLGLLFVGWFLPPGRGGR